MTLTQRLLLIFRGALISPFFSWLAVVLGVLVVYVLSASAPMLGETTWQDAAGFASQFWLTTFGGQVPLEAGSLSIMPLTLTFAYTCATYRIFRKRGVATWLEVAVATLTPTIFVTLVGLIAGEGSAWWYAIIGSIVINAGLAIFAGREFLFHDAPWYTRVVSVWPRIRILLGAAALIGLVFAIIATISGFSRIQEIHGYYLTDTAGSAGLIVLQLLYVPNMLVWGLGWLFGPGFSVGTDTNFSMLGAEAGPLPAIPAFGAIPGVNVEMPWMLAVITLAFLLLGVAHAMRNFGDRSRAQVAIDDLLAGTAVALTLAILAFVSSGGIGPGRMERLGVVPAHMLLAAVLLVVAPFMLGHVIGHPSTRAKVKDVMKRGNTDAEQPE